MIVAGLFVKKCLTWALKNWPVIMLMGALIGLAVLVGSWRVQRSTIRSLTIDVKTVEKEKQFAVNERNEKIEGLTGFIADLAEKAEAEKKRVQVREVLLIEGLNAANARNVILNDRATESTIEVTALIAAAETCEERESIFLTAMAEWVNE